MEPLSFKSPGGRMRSSLNEPMTVRQLGRVLWVPTSLAGFALPALS